MSDMVTSEMTSVDCEQNVNKDPTGSDKDCSSDSRRSRFEIGKHLVESARIDGLQIRFENFIGNSLTSLVCKVVPNGIETDHNCEKTVEDQLSSSEQDFDNPEAAGAGAAATPIPSSEDGREKIESRDGPGSPIERGISVVTKASMSAASHQSMSVRT